MAIEQCAGKALLTSDVVERIEPDDADVLDAALKLSGGGVGMRLQPGDSVGVGTQLVHVLEKDLLKVAYVHPLGESREHAPLSFETAMEDRLPCHDRNHDRDHGEKNGSRVLANCANDSVHPLVVPSDGAVSRERNTRQSRYPEPMAHRRPLYTAIAMLLVVIALNAMFEVVTVDGDSMMPTLRNGQIVIASRRTGPVRRGDIVLVRRGRDILVKRVAYLPGEELAPLDRPLFRQCSDFFEKGKSADSVRVPASRLVVMGDNRANSDDSRRFGPVPVADIVGRVTAALPFP